jgi:hypothetical protein
MRKLGFVKRGIAICIAMCCVSVANAQSGIGLLGGFLNGSDPYAAFVSVGDPNSTTQITFTSFTVGEIYGVAINSFNVGLIGGNSSNSLNEVPYAAFVALTNPFPTTEIIFPSTFTVGRINGTAINSAGTGLIGGGNGAPLAPYAAFVSSGNTSPTTVITPFTFTVGLINGTAINNSGIGLIGGVIGSGLTEAPYAAFVLAGSPSPTTTVSFSFTVGRMNGTAINDSNTGLIVGLRDNTLSPTPYAAYVVAGNPNPTTTISFSFTVGSIINAAINSTGTGLIGGVSTAGQVPYAAFVSSGTSSPTLEIIFPSTFTVGLINGTAINNAGIGLIGGANIGNSSAYAAFVSPLGILTPITLPLNAQIFRVGLNDATSGGNTILAAVVPESFGPSNSFATTLFGLSHVLECHYMDNKLLNTSTQSEPLAYLADFKDGFKRWYPPKSSEPNCCKQETVSLWAGVLGELAYQKKAEKFPAYSNAIAGAVVALDYSGIRDSIFGGGLAYGFDYVHYSEGIGHASVNQELALLYWSYHRAHFFLNVAVWGGIFQLDNERHTAVANVTSTAHTTGGLLLPHLELSTPFYAKCNWFVIDPFVMFDFANIWQGHLKEKGSSGLNIALNSQYSSMLRSEVGLRFHEILRYCWGSLDIEEKASYVNKTPFHTGPGTAFFIGAASSFTIETFSSQVENLGAVQLDFQFTPWDSRYPYGSLDYQGEFGSSFQSHTLVLEVGKNF